MKNWWFNERRLNLFWLPLQRVCTLKWGLIRITVSKTSYLFFKEMCCSALFFCPQVSGWHASLWTTRFLSSEPRTASGWTRKRSSKGTWWRVMPAKWTSLQTWGKSLLGTYCTPRNEEPHLIQINSWFATCFWPHVAVYNAFTKQCQLTHWHVMLVISVKTPI